MADVRFPEPLRAGDTIAVVAPSSPFGHADFWRGLAWLRDRYRIVVTSKIFERRGYLAGDDRRRAAELAHAMTAQEVRAVVAARGGYGATRILEDLPWEAFVKSPKWLVGFSDVTALHLRASALGIASVHGPHVTGLGRALPETRFAMLRALEQPNAAFSFSQLTAIRPGAAEGTVLGGNLSLFYAMAAAGDLVVPHGAIVLLEDVTERPYRVDRMLTALAVHLARASAIVFGGFTQCDPGPDGATLDEVLQDRTETLKIPVYRNAPFGHEDRNLAFVNGRRAVLEKNELRFL